MCTAAYREALTRALSSTASPAPAPAPGQRHATEAGRTEAGRTEAGRDDVAGRPLRPHANPRQNDLESRGVAAVGAVAESGPAMTLAKEATVVNGTVIDQH